MFIKNNGVCNANESMKELSQLVERITTIRTIKLYVGCVFNNNVKWKPNNRYKLKKVRSFAYS